MPINTISDVENLVQSGLESLRNLPLNDEITSALKYVVPDGYIPVVQLEEDGRKKRSTAAASNWTPETGEIHIYFERKSPSLRDVAAKRVQHSIAPIAAAAQPEAAQPIRVIDPISTAELAQCCEALDSAEKLNRQFIAIKWFRDDFLITQGFSWTASDQRRQQVLTHAIEIGRILAKKIPNPRSPQFPTTTVYLNRTVSTSTVAPRYQPVPVRGEPVSATLLRDRGPR